MMRRGPATSAGSLCVQYLSAMARKPHIDDPMNAHTTPIGDVSPQVRPSRHSFTTGNWLCSMVTLAKP